MAKRSRRHEKATEQALFSTESGPAAVVTQPDRLPTHERHAKQSKVNLPVGRNTNKGIPTNWEQKERERERTRQSARTAPAVAPAVTIANADGNIGWDEHTREHGHAPHDSPTTPREYVYVLCVNRKLEYAVARVDVRDVIHEHVIVDGRRWQTLTWELWREVQREATRIEDGHAAGTGTVPEDLYITVSLRYLALLDEIERRGGSSYLPRAWWEWERTRAPVKETLDTST